MDALIDHSEARVALVDRRHSVGGHWLDAYPFVRLHQASSFYGVASTLLGGGRSRSAGPRPACTNGRPSPRSAPTTATCWPAGRLGPGRAVRQLRVRRGPPGRLADLRRRFEVPSGVGSSTRGTSRRTSRRGPRRRSRSRTAPGWSRSTTWSLWPRRRSQYVVVGSGKTATDACVWLLSRGVDAGCDLLGAAPRSLDAEPGRRPAGAGRVPRHGRRHDAGRGSSDLVAGPVPRGWRTPASCGASTGRSPPRWPRRPPWRTGSSTSCAPSRTSCGWGTYAAWSRAGSPSSRGRRGRAGRGRGALRRVRAAVPTERRDLGAVGDHLAADPQRVPVLRGGARRLRGGHP